MFDYIQNIRSHHTVPCTAEILHTVMRSTIVGQTCAEIADCHEQLLRGEMSRDDFETKKSELKRRLPAFCFHAHFKNGRRLNAEAIASGLSILDIDHIGRHSEGGCCQTKLPCHFPSSLLSFSNKPYLCRHFLAYVLVFLYLYSVKQNQQSYASKTDFPRSQSIFQNI